MYTKEDAYISPDATAQTVDALHCTLSHMKSVCPACVSQTYNQAARDMVTKTFGTTHWKFIDMWYH